MLQSGSTHVGRSVSMRHCVEPSGKTPSLTFSPAWVMPWSS